MINYINISSFTNWFIDSFITIITDVWEKLNNIELVTGVTLLNFIIVIIILQIFLGIVLTAPNRVKIKERKIKSDK